MHQGGPPSHFQQFWLAPPSRFLKIDGLGRSGFDGDLLIGEGGFIPEDPLGRARLWRWVLPLLLPDPSDLGLTLAREWNATLGTCQ